MKVLIFVERNFVFVFNKVFSPVRQRFINRFILCLHVIVGETVRVGQLLSYKFYMCVKLFAELIDTGFKICFNKLHLILR